MKTLVKVAFFGFFMWLFFATIGYYFRSLTLIGNQILISPDNKSLYLSINFPKREEANIFQLTWSGKIQRRLTSGGGVELCAVEKRNCLLLNRTQKSGEGTEVVLVDPESRTEKVIMVSDQLDLSFQLSEDGESLLFIRSTKSYPEHMGVGHSRGGWQLFSYGIKNKTFSQWTFPPNQVLQPRYVSKNSIFFLQKRELKDQVSVFLCSLDLNTKFQTDIEKDVYDYILSADKKTLIYNQSTQDSHRYQVSQLVSMNITAREKKILYVAKVGVDIPGFALSPDGSKLVMIQKSGFDRSNQNSKLVVLDLKTGAEKQIPIKYYGITLDDSNWCSISKWIQELWYM